MLELCNTLCNVFTRVALSMLLKQQGDNSKIIVSFCYFFTAFPKASAAEHVKDMPPNLPFHKQIKEQQVCYQ